MTEAQLLEQFSLNNDMLWDFHQWWVSVTFGLLALALVDQGSAASSTERFLDALDNASDSISSRGLRVARPMLFFGSITYLVFRHVAARRQKSA